MPDNIPALLGSIFALLAGLVFGGHKLINMFRTTNATTDAQIETIGAHAELFKTLREELKELRKETKLLRRQVRLLIKQKTLLEAIARKAGVDVEAEYAKAGISPSDEVDEEDDDE